MVFLELCGPGPGYGVEEAEKGCIADGSRY
jgi:hypothetical protein